MFGGNGSGFVTYATNFRKKDLKMANRTKIKWTDFTWNPITGCTKYSEGCQNCYAEGMTRRLKAMGQPKYSAGFNMVVCHEIELSRQLPKKPSMIFINSMSDTFHKNVFDSFIINLFEIMNDNPQHIFQVLTKRAERLPMMNNRLHWTPNI